LLKVLGIRDAYFLGKLLEGAFFKPQRIEFHNLSTWVVDWDVTSHRNKNIFEKILFENFFMTERHPRTMKMPQG
jgi:hypothetical protein